jgi:hypothetical protein
MLLLWNAVLPGNKKFYKKKKKKKKLGMDTQTVGHDLLRSRYITVKLGHPVHGGYKYGDLALQVWRASNGQVKYGREFFGTWTQE